MNIIFAGPTISHAHIRQHLDCVCLSPVSHGDVLAALEQAPDAIGIIDGYFEGVPSVWHKEILYAMDQGVTVYGSASMGALRAAELYDFGMVGVGRIFEHYRDGLLQDDDEVAVVHGPQETGFLAASVPMVNIRATLDAAQDQDIIDGVKKSALLSNAKSTFYKQRSWNSLLRAGSDIFADKLAYEAFASWLTEHKVDQKRDDAIQMLQLMKQPQASAAPEQARSFFFQWTNLWDMAFSEHRQSQKNQIQLNEDELIVLDQLRQHSELYQRYHDKALLSWVCRNTADIAVDEQAEKAAFNQFREYNRLDSRGQLIDYMEKSALSEARLTSYLTDAARVDSASQAAGDLQLDIIKQLKLDGQYLRLLESAAAQTGQT